MDHLPKQQQHTTTATTTLLDFNTSVQTPFGEGTLLGYREDDSMFVVHLDTFRGVLYCQREWLSRRTMAPDQLDVAFEALEKARKLNLEVECNEMGIQYDTHLCTTCVLSDDNHQTKKKPRKKANTATTTCIVCGNPTCSAHQSPGFKKQKMAVCQACETLFDLDFYHMIHGERWLDGKSRNGVPSIQEEDDETIEEETSPRTPMDPALLTDKVLQMQETYGRVMLLLSRDSQYIPGLQTRLMTTEARNNHIDAGTSATSAMAGVLGLVGAATILTPFGAPLLMASLAVGGSSSAVSLGNGAVNWYQQPNKAADRILALHGLASALLKSMQSLVRAAAEMDPSLFRNGDGDDNGGVSDENNNNINHQNYVGHLNQGLEVVRNADEALSLANTAAAASSTFQTSFPKTAAAISQGANWTLAVPILGTALSGIFIYMDTHRLQSTLARINAGNVSEKAQALQKIQGDLLIFPQSNEVEKQSQICLNAIHQHGNR